MVHVGFSVLKEVDIRIYYYILDVPPCNLKEVYRLSGNILTPSSESKSK
jgi:hypothetical protein